jgi:hypothetical protein
MTRDALILHFLSPRNAASLARESVTKTPNKGCISMSAPAALQVAKISPKDARA